MKKYQHPRTKSFIIGTSNPVMQASINIHHEIGSSEDVADIGLFE